MVENKLSYLTAGAWNTVFGYVVSIGIYELLSKHADIFTIGIIINIITITSAFIIYKLYVFKTKGKWFVEYLRCFLVYGWTAIFGIGMLWLLVENLKVRFFIAQGVSTILTIIISYCLHNKFTFKK
jgi:putative flippase GtrA